MIAIRRCDDIDLILDLDERVMSGSSLITRNAAQRSTWWVGYDGAKPVAYAGVCKGQKEWRGLAYADRCGVLKEYRGQGLQRRMLRVRERYARKQGWTGLWAYSAAWNAYSSNNLIACGWQVFEPRWIDHEYGFVCFVKCFDERSWLDYSLADGRPKRKRSAA